MSEQLKPCPFCGKVPEVKVKESVFSATGSVFTIDCGDRSFPHSHALSITKGEAIRIWNTRTPDLSSLLARCKPLLEILDNSDKQGVTPYYQTELTALLSEIAQAEAGR